MTAKIPQTVAYFEGEGPSLSDADWRKIERAGALELGDAHRRAIADALTSYFEWSLLDKTAVRPGTFKEGLAVIGRRANALADAIEKTAPAGGNPNFGPAGREIRRRALHSKPRLPDLDAIMKSAAALGAIASAAVNELPRDFGRSPDRVVRPLVLSLVDAFDAAGGDGHYTARAIAFVQTVLALIGRPLQPGQVKSLIEKSVPRRRRSRKSAATA